MTTATFLYLFMTSTLKGFPDLGRSRWQTHSTLDVVTAYLEQRLSLLRADLSSQPPAALTIHCSWIVLLVEDKQ